RSWATAACCRPVNDRALRPVRKVFEPKPRVSEAEPTSMLVAAAHRGDGSALDKLYRRFAPVVHGILLGYVQHADADDLTQQVFEQAFGRLPALRDAAAFPGWITSIARRTALDERRRNAPLTGMDIDAVATDASP